MSSSPVIQTTHLFSELDRVLIDLLQSLTAEEWRRPTIVPRWNVHQIACHLLDTAIRRLAMCRDGWSNRADGFDSDHDLVELINQANEQGVAAFGRLSPELLVELTALVTPQLAQFFAGLDPMAPALFPVSWAGERQSVSWFDVAREYTERWHHQQQIRLATDRSSILTARLYAPVLETFMRALPHTYRDVHAPVGTRCDILVTGEVSGKWSVTRSRHGWQLVRMPPAEQPAATCIIPDDLAWRLFTKGAGREEAQSRIRIEGDARLGEVILRARAIVG